MPDRQHAVSWPGGRTGHLPPLRVLVRADAEGRSYLAFHPIGPVLLRAGGPEAQAGQLARAQDILVQLLRN